MAAATSRRIFQQFLPIMRVSFRRNVICQVRSANMLRVNFGRPVSVTAIGSCSTTTTDAKQEDMSPQVDDSQISEGMCDPYVEEQQPCLLCKANIPVSFKNVQLLSQFVSPNTGLMYDRKITRLCHYQHQRVEREVTISRQFGLMPYMYRETVFLKDPSLYRVPYIGNPNIGSKVELPRSTVDFEKISKPVDTQTTMMAVKKKKQPLFKAGKLIVKKKKK